jgi:hypothetical protein
MSIKTAVGVWTTEESVFDLAMGKRFSLLHSVHTSYCSRPACYRVESVGPFRRIKCQGFELGHAHLDAKVKDLWSCISTSKTSKTTSSPCTNFCAWTTDDILHPISCISCTISKLLAYSRRYSYFTSQPLQFWIYHTTILSCLYILFYTLYYCGFIIFLLMSFLRKI